MGFTQKYEEKGEPKGKIEKKMEWTTTERKIKCREGCEQKTKIKPAQLQEKKERKRSEK